MRSRRFIIATLAGFALLGGVTAGANNATAAGPSGCRISGTAHINPGLSTKAQNFTDTFSGAFSNCANGPVKSGSITEVGSGNGSCATATTAGIATVRWNNGQTSTIKLTTKGVGSVLKVAGTFTAGLFKGSKASALLNFNANPTQCATGGVTTVTFVGAGKIG
ncbi:MAG: hypothetical protein QOG53_3645 [Frankiales bacterium]|jgi:hypothetical protein|nr:hypothetical protein [Frankiales bacterium]